MHILDVISSVSGSSKCDKIVGGWGFAPDPIMAVHQPLAGFKGAYFKAPTFKGRGREGEVRQNDLCPGRQKPSYRHCSSDSEVGQGAL